MCAGAHEASQRSGGRCLCAYVCRGGGMSDEEARGVDKEGGVL